MHVARSNTAGLASRSYHWFASLSLTFTLIMGSFVPPLLGTNNRPLLASPPSVVLSVPAQAFIGENVSFTATFSNPDADTGYGPVLDLILPAMGADGDVVTLEPPDGLGNNSISASYLGSTLTPVEVVFDLTCQAVHPFVRDVSGALIVVTCPPGVQPGDKLVSMRLPFGSFTVNQPAAVVDITVDMSNLADLGHPLEIQARGGYEFGYTPINDFPTDPAVNTLSAWVTGSVEPTLVQFSKSYGGPEGETATGPNYPRQYNLQAQIASGQSVTGLTLVDTLPDNLQFLNVISTNPPGAVCTTPPPATPGGTVSCAFPGSVSGTASVLFSFYVPLEDASSSRVINPVTGDDVDSCNNASLNAAWQPIDPRDWDLVTPIPVDMDQTGCEHNLTDKSIAIQKGVIVVGGGQPAPGELLQYTLGVQVSDFFAFERVVITDTLSDGQHFEPGFTPTLLVNGNGYTLSIPFLPANFTVSCNYTGAQLAPVGECDEIDPAPDNGSTTIRFRVSDQIAASGPDARLIGGCINPATGNPAPDCGTFDDGATTVQVVFRSEVQQTFINTFIGTPSVDQGDSLSNQVSVVGDVLDTGTLTPTGSSEQDTSSAGVSIGVGNVAKSIYSVNGVAPGPQVEIAPGDAVTYRIQYTLSTGDVENLFFEDYFPLPIFRVMDPDADNVGGPAWSFDGAGCLSANGTSPAAGVVKFGPNDTYCAYSGIIPTLTTNLANNRLTLTYGNFNGAVETTYAVDLLFTVTVTDAPFADRLFLTNQVRASESNTSGEASTGDALAQVILTQPMLAISKGVVEVDNPAGIIAPLPVGPVLFDQASCPRFATPITSSGLATNPVNSDLSLVDAGDRVTMAITIENTGSGVNGVFDVHLRDELPAGLVLVPGSLCVTDGNGTLLPYTGSEADFFTSTGIVLDDPAPLSGSLSVYDPNSGLNIAVITYQVDLGGGVIPNEVLTNTASILQYAGVEGGADHLVVPRTDTAEVTVAEPSATKTLVTTEISDGFNDHTEAVIGELLTYEVTLTPIEGLIPNVLIVDTLDAGMAFVDCAPIAASPDLSTNLGVGDFSDLCNPGTNPADNPVISNNGRTITLDLGDIINANTDNTTAETLTFQYRVIVLNVSGNQAGTLLNNEAVFEFDNNGSFTASAANVRVIEPTVNTAKTVLPPTSGDAGDVITFSITMNNPVGMNAAIAHDVTWSDPIPANMAYVPGSFAVGACTSVLPVLDDSGPSPLLATWTSIQPGQSCTLTFQATIDFTVLPGQTLTNTAQTRWTSLPGIEMDRSAFNGSSDERTGVGGLLGGGAVNDYRTEGQATVTVNTTTPEKFILATSEAHTTIVGGVSRVAIGEIVRYRLVIGLPEGSSPNFQIQDNLPPGMVFLNDGTAKAAFVSHNGITSTGLGIVTAVNDLNCQITGDAADGVSPAIPVACPPLADVNIGSSNSTAANLDAYASGTDPFFKLGNLALTDSDADPEYVIIEFNALVMNIGGNGTGTNRSNNFTVFINGSQVGANSNSVTVRTAQPLLSVSKTDALDPSEDAGDALVYTLTVTAASGNDMATAFDLVIEDVLDSHLAPGVIGVASTQGAFCAGGDTAFATSANTVGQTVTVTASCLDPGESITVTINTSVVASAPAGQIIPNEAELTYTSLPGDYGTTSNPTGSALDNLPGYATAPGQANGERTGDGTGPNTYADADAVQNALSIPEIEKQQPNPAVYTIGDTVVYDILITLPEGVTQQLAVFDDLPAGTDYVSYSVITTAAASGGLLAADFAGVLSPAPVLTAPGGSGANVTLAFGDTTTAADNDVTNNQFVVRITALVLDLYPIPNVSDGQVLSNRADLNYQDPNTGNTVTITGNTVTITVREPRIQTLKSVLPVAAVEAGDLLTYTVRFTNTGNVTAFDVVAIDTLAQGTAFTALLGCTDGVNPIVSQVTDNGTELIFDGNPAGDWDINPGEYIECTYTVTAQPSLLMGGNHTNTIDANWSTQNGIDPNERVYDDDPIGYPFDGTQDTDTATFAVDLIALDKSDNGQLTATIGEIINYTLTITAPLGTAQNLMLTDTLPEGLIFVTGSEAVGAGISAPATFDVSVPNDGSAAVTLTWDFGNAVFSANTVSITFQAQVANTLPNQLGLGLTNTAVLDYDDAAGTPVTLSDSDGFTVVEPVVTIDKTITALPAPVDAGSVVSYQVVIENSSAVNVSTAFDALFADTLPAELALDLLSVAWLEQNGATGVTNLSAGNMVSLQIAQIPPGGSVTVTYSATIQSGAQPGQTIDNTGDVTWTSLLGNPSGERDGSGGVNDYATSDDATFDIDTGSFTKALDATSAAHTLGSDVTIGEVATYAFTVTLPEGTTTSLSIEDVLPAGLAYVDPSLSLDVVGFNGVINPGSLSLSCAADCGSSGSGDTITIEIADPITVTSDNDPTNNSFILRIQVLVLNEAGNQNTLTLSNNAALQVAGGPAQPTAPVTVTVVEPELQVVKSVNNATPGLSQVVTFTLELSHLPTSSAIGMDLVLTDNVPAELQVDPISLAFTSTPLNCAVGVDTSNSSANTVDVRVDELPLGCVLQVTFDAEVLFPPLSLGDTVTNDATVTWTSLPGTDPNERDGSGGVNDYSADDSLDLLITGIDLAIVKDDGGVTVQPGDDIIYTLNYTNLGNGPATNVVISDVVPVNTSFNAALSPVGWTCLPNNLAGSTCTYTTIPLLNPGDSGSVTFVLTLNNPFPAGVTHVTNTATITDDGTHGDDENPTDNTSTVDTPLVADIDLEITKDDGLTIVAPGSVLTYTLTISNVGNKGSTNVEVIDTLPADVTFLSASDGGVEAGGIVTWPLFDLPAGDTVTRTLTVQVNDPFPVGVTQITNSVEVDDDGTNGVDPTPANNLDDDTDQLVTLQNGNLTKVVTATNQLFTTDPDVAIGEIVSYEATLTIPPGRLDDMFVVDTLSKGLAFLSCTDVVASNVTLTTTVVGGFGAICGLAVFEETPAGSPDPQDEGRRMVLDFEEVNNLGLANETITIRYDVVVLNIESNVSGVPLDNDLSWEWRGGVLDTSANDVIIVEPQLALAMSVNSDVVMPGEILTFRLVVNHSANSLSDTFNAVLTDTLPVGLNYIPGSIRHVSGQIPTLMAQTGPFTLEITWDDFLNDGTNSVIEFQVRAGNVVPGMPLVNNALVAWSSLPGPMSLPQSPYNAFSNERSYLPGDPLNPYATEASLAITVPELPQTGFAPGRVTAIPELAAPPYQELGGLRLEIPRLNVATSIVGVPLQGGEWDVTWLNQEAGYLEGTAYPTLTGNSVLTAHVYLPNGLPGPFVDLHTLTWGDRVVVYSEGYKYTYEVRRVERTKPEDISMLQPEKDFAWLTLLTCQGYDERTDTYQWRVAARAVLMSIEPAP